MDFTDFKLWPCYLFSVFLSELSILRRRTEANDTSPLSVRDFWIGVQDGTSHHTCEIVVECTTALLNGEGPSAGGDELATKKATGSCRVSLIQMDVLSTAIGAVVRPSTLFHDAWQKCVIARPEQPCGGDVAPKRETA